MARPARKQIKAGTANHVVINDTNGDLSSEARLATSRGGTGQDFSASTGFIKDTAGTFSAQAQISLTADVSGTLPIANGGTNATTANAALNNLLPSQTSNSGKFLQTDGTNTSWQTTTTSAVSSSSYQITNLGLTAVAASNALTINITDSAGGTPSGASPVSIGFRSATVTSGLFNVRSLTAAVSLVIPSGTTIGTNDGLQSWIWVYALELDASTIELAVSLNRHDERSVKSTVAISGGNLATALYSDSARGGKPIRLIGRIIITWATSTWSANPSEISVQPLETISIPMTVQKFTSGSGTGATAYKTPTNPFPRSIRVKMAGGGGGGSGSGTTGATNGNATTASTSTSFGTSFITAFAGAGGAFQGAAGAPGSPVVNSPALDIASTLGGVGGGYWFSSGLTSTSFSGPLGGQTPFFAGGAPSGQYVQPGSNAGSNTGGGGAGGSAQAAANCYTGSGGGSGAYVEAVIPTPLSTYNYVVGVGGSGGTAGTSGTNGGAGGSGIIIVEEYYQ